MRHSLHIANIINIASQMSHLIVSKLVRLDISTFNSAFVTYVKPLLQHNSVVWFPHYISPTSVH